MALYCPNCGKMAADDAAFCSYCGRALNPAAPPYAYRPPLVRARVGRKVAGVCQGVANHLGWDVTLLRVLTVIVSIVLFPLGIIAYLICWLVIPEEALVLPPVAQAKPTA